MMKLSRSLAGSLLAFVLVFFLLPSSPAIAATTIHVSASATGVNDGTSWANAFVDLQDALAVAVAGDEIRVAAGTYTPDASDRAVSFEPADGVTITGGYSTSGGYSPSLFETVLSGDLLGNDNTNLVHTEPTRAENSYNVLRGVSADITLRNLTITGGNANGAVQAVGGGIYFFNLSRNVLIDNVLVTENTASVNTAGLLLQSVLEPSLVINSTITNNHSGSFNGGMNLTGTTVTNTEITNNSAARGGGGAIKDVDFINVLVANNTADFGGAFWVSNAGISTAIFTNVTIANNTATDRGSVIGSNVTTSPIVTTFNNSIISGNSEPLFETLLTAPAVSYSNVQGGYVGTGNIAGNPFFADVANGDYHLLPGSPSLNNADLASLGADVHDVDGDGNTTEAPADLDLVARPLGDGLDMGAFESAYVCPTGAFTLVSAVATGTGDGSSWANAYPNLQHGLNTASTCAAVSEVRVAAGTYKPDESDRDASFEPADGVTITGGYSTSGGYSPTFYETILSGDLLGNDNTNLVHTEPTRADNSYSVVSGARADVTLRNLTVTGGNANATGQVSVGGIYFFYPSENIRIDNLLITKNTASINTAGLNLNTPLVPSLVVDSIVTNNHSGSFYGGVNLASVTVINTEITNNSATRGGGGSINNVDFINVLVADNAASTNGGAFYNSSNTTSPSTFTNSTIANNTAADAGGVFGVAVGASLPSLTFANSIIWGNTAPTDPTFSGSPAPVITSTNIQGGFAGANNISTDPRFLDPGAGDYRLTHLSPAENVADVNALPADTFDIDNDGNLAEVIPTDLVGADRVQLGALDMGALETAPPAPRGFTTLATPCVLFDSRSSTGPLAGIFTGGELRSLTATGPVPGNQGAPAGTCIPAGVTAATVTITAIGPAQSGNLRLSASGIIPNGGVVNYAANGLNNSNTVTTEISLDGKIDVFANAPASFGLASTHVRIAVIGYHPHTGGDTFVPLTPCAVVDSRSSQGALGIFIGPFAPSPAFPVVDVVGTFPAAQGGGNTDCGVPVGATAVVANLVAVGAAGGNGGLEAGTGGNNPSERLVNFAPVGVNNAAQVIIPLVGGQTVSIDIVGQPAATVDVRMVVLGYYISAGGSGFVPLTACAVFDTRDTQGSSGTFTGNRLGGATTTYQVAGDIPADQGGLNSGDCGVPIGASAVLINTVAIAPDVGGNFQAYATGTSPTGGILNFGPTTPAANNSNAIPIPISASGAIDLFTNTGSSVAPATHARGVVLGYYD